MALSAFDDERAEPSGKELASVLGRSGRAWEVLLSRLSDQYSPLTTVWNHSGKKWGWVLRLIQKKRTILYMTPLQKHFYVGFVLGEKAVAKALEAGLPPSIVNAIEDAPRYGEGRGVKLKVRVLADLEAIGTIAEAKMST